MSTAPVPNHDGFDGPLPRAGELAWIENLPTGPSPTEVTELRGDLVRIDPPRVGGETLPLRTGTPILLAYQIARVPCEARTVVVTAPPGADEGPWLRVTAITRIQRRGAVRVPVMLVARIAVRGDGPEREPVSGVTEDVSANGALVRLKEPLAEGAMVNVIMHLGGDFGDLAERGRVVRVEKDLQAGVTRPWKVAVTFPFMTRVVEDRMVRFIFERQREVRARETGLD